MALSKYNTEYWNSKNILDNYIRYNEFRIGNEYMSRPLKNSKVDV